MSGLNQAVEDYLTTRRALGFKLERHGRLLPHLVGYLERAGAATVTTELALAWATQSEGHPDESAKRLSVARGFARYLQTLDSNAEVPAADLLARQQRRASPYLYSYADVVALMAATSTLRFPLRSATYRTLIGLLAVTGMRVGEAIGLVRDDLDWSHRRLIIREGKFGASRELPLHPSTIDALEMYARLRDQCWPQPRSPFFISMAGTRLIHENVHWTFRRLVRHVGLQPRSASCRPRIHDLRHTFAVNTLIDWYRSGVDVGAWMPRLSTYLGHAAPAWTYWYLSATPELLSLAAARLDQSERHPV
ncbi:MAG: integrase [Chloroflexi bacterium]|nr:MAG: integrase [Chloroflexota bacterium]